MEILGYCRVSTKKQLSGNGIEVQKIEILSKYDNAKIFLEQHTGSTKERPVFKEVLEKLKSGDLLVVNKLDRLARNTVEGIQIVQDLFKKNVGVHILNIGLLENTSMGKFFLTVLLAIAEMEKNTIIERTHAGKEVARLDPNYREGPKPKYTESQLNWAIDLLNENSYNKVSRMTGISKSTIIRAVRKKRLEIGDGQNKS